MPAVLLLAIERAITPSDAVEALLTLQTMLIGDIAAQVCEILINLIMMCMKRT